MALEPEIRKYADQIIDKCAQTKQKWVEIGALVANPPRPLTDEERAEIAVRFPGGKTELSKANEIGKAVWLHTTEVLDNVPAGKDLLYEIVKLGEDKVRQGISDGSITPATQRHELRAMRGMNPSSATNKRALPKGLLAALKLKGELTEHQRAQIVAKLQALAEEHELELVVEASDDEKRAEKRWRDAGNAQINGVRKRQGPRWEYAEANLTIGAGDGYERGQEIFDMLGIDVDVLSLVRQAYTEYGLNPPGSAR